MPDRAKAAAANRILAALPAADYALLAPRLTRTALSAGAVLHEAGDVIAHVHFPLDGIISLVTVMQAGDTIDSAMVGREGATGMMAGFGERRAFSRAVAQIAGVALRIDASHFQSAMTQSSALQMAALRCDALLSMQVQQTAACNALHPVEARLARLLLQTRDRIGGTAIPLTQESLAQMLGVQRTTVTVAMNAFEQAGLIRKQRGGLDIVDSAGLERAACECYGVMRRHVEDVAS